MENPEFAYNHWFGAEVHGALSGTEEKGMWGPKKEAEAAPPALGEEAPPAPTSEAGRSGRDLFFALVSFPFTKKRVGDFRGPASGAQARLLGAGEGAQHRSGSMLPK